MKASDLCPRCGVEMIPGRLKVPLESVYIVSSQTTDTSLLKALICPNCGHVELLATQPDKLCQHDDAV